ncbi:posphoenolpyruvate synthetase regulatory kinase/phosphorylase PpsR [Paludibacterium yongneupense]|uniref:posphoenolpyruvate synthetase regulatory kinase/phosphorylase PpsR n=1 Tax=Paludibacterium yongneupense TaxID=400061 RepID=UPI00042A1D66|nr:pyruvate, water dikinase regulatory protein [Paludibacterium yongneupense]
MPRTAFFISGRTAITSEVLGHSLLSQFDHTTFRHITLPYVDTVEKAEHAVAQIRAQAIADGCRPLVFSTVVEENVRKILYIKEALVLDFFETYVSPLEQELGIKSSHTSGKVHGIANLEQYQHRINAINFSMRNDDGSMQSTLHDADVILIGVSRCGKTPTCLYLALHYGIKAANFPLTPDDFAERALPKDLLPYQNKLFGLTIDPERLSKIRHERKSNSQYASVESCRKEVAEAERMMQRHGITPLNTTTLSIEELATTILQLGGLKRRIF